MAASSSNPSFIVEVAEDYPYPSHISNPNITVKLSGKDRYKAWKTHMLCILMSQNMLGFINGEFAIPKENGNGKEKGKVGDVKAWARSDALAKSWIFGSLSEEATMYVVDRLTSTVPNADFTAKDVWDELECIYGPQIYQQATGETEIIREEDAKSEDKSKDKEETNQQERERMEIKTEAYQRLYEYTVDRWMHGVDSILGLGEVSVTDKITGNGNTALHVAVGTSNKDPEFFEELLKMTPEDIQLKDLKNADGSTLLHIAAIVGNTPAAKLLVEIYPDMLVQKDNDGQTPLDVALSNMHTKTAECLLDKIEKDGIHKDTLFSGTSGDELLVLAISSKEFELAGRLLEKYYSNLHSDVVLMAIAQNFPSKLGFWNINACFDFVLQMERGTRFTRIFRSGQSCYILQEISLLFRYAIWKCVPSMRRSLRIQLYARLLLADVCKLIQSTVSSSQHKNYYTNPVVEATRLDSSNFVTDIVTCFPNAFWSETEDGHNVIQYAVINRSEKIYNLLYHMSEHKNVYKTIKDASRNNLLHLAARLAPSEKLNLISGAALQIQYELQWYKEVERFVCPLNITQKNSFGETPQMVFTRTHKELVTEGERWMKSTAESYTITAALITTIVFAAAITVPGGNKDTGVPIFTNNPAFTIFAVSDAISLFTAVMSLLMFLSILTARFAEEDFLYKLPRKLIIGLVTLFISTTTMIIAFGAALFIVFGQNNGSLLISIGALTGLTITFFVTLQLSLVIDLMRATYGRSIFGRKSENIYFKF